MGPVVRGRKGEHAKVFEDLRKAGYVRVMVDGNVDELTADFALEKNKKHTISAVSYTHLIIVYVPDEEPNGND